jgi:PAS domain-containing protein
MGPAAPGYARLRTLDRRHGTDDMGDDAKREPGEDGDDLAEVLAEMRARLDEAASDIERLTAELAARTKALDELEGLADVLLGAGAAAVVVTRPDRRVRALSPRAAELLGVDGTPVGKALSSVVPDEVADATRDHLVGLADHPVAGPAGDGEDVVAGPWTVHVTGLPDGGAVLVLRET